MADVIKKATNKFTRGLVMDFSPENTRNEVLTNALNATLLTFNGNELSLQNDMGNARVETAYLPEGYIPVGTCEYGGIIYIVSYNPLEDKSQIGCFPSPERNVSNDELGVQDAQLFAEDFQAFNGEVATGTLQNTSKYVLLKNDKLNPGDKFIITANRDIYHERLQDLLMRQSSKDTWHQADNPILSLNIVSIEDSGKIVYLNSDVLYYDTSVTNTEEKLIDYTYYILGQDKEGFQKQAPDIDSYRNVVSSGYNVFKAKTSGKLAILAELIMIDSYSVTHSVNPDEENECKFNVVIHTDVEPILTDENRLYAPKLRYYYLKNSQGVLSTFSGGQEQQLNLYINNSKNEKYTNVKLNGNDEPLYVGLPYDSNDKLQPYKLNLDQFDFPTPKTYHGNIERIIYKEEIQEATLVKFNANSKHRISYAQLGKLKGTSYANQLKLYIYNEEGQYEQATYDENSNQTYYVKYSKIEHVDAKRNKDEHEGKDLYKAEGKLKRFDSSKECATAEKYIYLNTIIYTPVLGKDIKLGEIIYSYDINTNKYSQVYTPPITDKIYYKEENTKVLTSIGYTVDSYSLALGVYYRSSDMVYNKVSKEEKEAAENGFNPNDYTPDKMMRSAQGYMSKTPSMASMPSMPKIDIPKF